MNFLAGLVVILSGLALIVFASFLFSYPIFLLWNGCLVGAVAGVAEVTWLQAWGLAILCGMLFKTTVSKS